MPFKGVACSINQLKETLTIYVRNINCSTSVSIQAKQSNEFSMSRMKQKHHIKSFYISSRIYPM